jgi:K+-sensing histidine kinase KdpD/DNA-binding response OmpR family regulator
MLREILKVLTIQESEEPRVRPVLQRMIGGGTVGAVIFTVGSYAAFVASNLQVGGVLGLWMAVGPIVLIIFVLLGRLYRLERVSTNLALNLFMGVLTLSAALVEPLGFPIHRIHMLLYLAPIATASLLLPPLATLVWGGIVTAAILSQWLFSVILLGGHPDPGVAATVIFGTPLLHITTLIIWLAARLSAEEKEALSQRIQQGQASIEIGRTVSSSLDPASVVRQAVHLIYEAFGYFHVGIFTVDPDSDIAVLADAEGMGADEMLARSFFVPLVGSSAVAAAIHDKTRWMNVSWEERRDSRGRTVQFTHERLPMRAELVLPIQVGEQVLGAVDILSTALDPFSEEDIHTLEGLVGNVANALESARLLDDVKQRHQELEIIHAQTARRAGYLQATAELARAISTLLDPQELLDRAVELVSQSLGLYHASVFMVDDAEDWAVLVAANSEGGQRMLARGHRLRVGRQGIVGWVAESGEPRIALDVGEDAVFFDSPDLPETRSEVALPLRVGERVIGVLDVQSKRESAFGDEDTVVLQTLADQIAVGIQNARLFQETQRALDEVQALQRYYVAQEWGRASVQRSGFQAEYRTLGTPSLAGTWTPEMDMALDKGSPIILSDLGSLDVREDGRGNEWKNPTEELQPQAALAIPIKLQDEVIGVLDLQELDEKREWTQEEVEMATTVADQLALALENARLVEETQRRARQLEAASAVARDATAILDVEQLLNETVELISERFDFYHAGAFLIDDQGEYAVMQAASSEGGKRMLARNHRLKVGEVGIVGYVAASGESRVASDVGVDAVWFNAPELPQTRSEMALPLKARERVIGVLDVQSKEEEAFSEEDVAVLQTLADQLATAIANADLFQRVRDDATRRTLINEVTQAAASSLDIAELLARAAQAIASQLEMPCVIFQWDDGTESLIPLSVRNQMGADVTPVEMPRFTRQMDPALFQAIRTRQLQVLFNVPSSVEGAAAQLAQQLDLVDAAYMPLMSRDQPLGVLALGRQRGHPALDEGQLSFLEVVAANLGVALENAKLFQDAVETAERLAEVDRLKTQFLATMSHELRTPLNSIIGFTRVILKEIDGPLTDLQRTDLQTVYDSGNHLLGLINNILDVMRIEAGKMEITIEDVEIPPIVRGVMDVAKALVKDKGLALEEDLPDDLPTIKADGRRVRQVLLNLVGNAAKFTEEGFIRVKVRVDGPDVVFAVIDSGIGIPEDKLAMIFDAFTQVDSSSTRKAGGTGLGLSICQSFVQMHKGRIWVESVAGQGSTFFFSIPIEGPSLEEEPDEEVVVEQPEDEDVSVLFEEPVATSKLVLCVEDDEGVIALFRRYLSKRGYQVVGLTDPARVVDEARRLNPHAITLDVMMPGKNGWQVIQELKNDPNTRHIPVIMCSIIAEKDRGMSLGAADYLVKPVIEEDLLVALDRLDRESGHHLVLLVDDQIEHRQLLRRMIENVDGYEVIEAGGGREAVDLLGHIHPHLIMLDLMMPEMDGFEVLETVKGNESTRSIPIVVVTAKELSEEDYERLNHSVEALIQKGLMKQEELLEDVAAALHRLTRPVPAGE